LQAFDLSACANPLVIGWKKWRIEDLIEVSLTCLHFFVQASPSTPSPAQDHWVSFAGI